MRLLLFSYLFLCPCTSFGQNDFQRHFRECEVQGSTTIYDYKNNQWKFTDSLDAFTETLPASSFKVINLLIALETGIIKDEHDTIKWIGSIDTA
ncbi:MAG TPA: penicillin-binding transpeptidase domain-containing protein, partial [Chitinophagaceae bacterium]|nr:penicillin-binding transpeptidase domain-containing protein [Chitinophagaceae bacterium]